MVNSYSPLANSDDRVFKTSEQIKKTLFRVRTLTDAERATVTAALIKNMDNNGVSREEFRDVVFHLWGKKEISEIDKNQLLKLL